MMGRMMPFLFASALWAGSVHDFELKTIDGKPLPLNQYKGKVLLIVNTASY
jgi:glutathione peroxidase